VLAGLVLAGLAVGLGAAAFWARPQLVSVSPAPETTGLSPRARIHLTFNQPMQAESLVAAITVSPTITGAWALDLAGLDYVFTPAEPWPLNVTATVRLAGGRGLNGLPQLETRTWSFGIGGERILYLASLPSQVASISLEARSSDDAEVMTDLPAGVREFDLSPEGSWLVYTLPRADGGSDLWRMNVDGSDPQLLLDCAPDACRYPEVAPNARRVAYERQIRLDRESREPTAFGEARVEVLTVATGVRELAAGAANQTRLPRWGPDGRLVVYDTTRTAFAIVDVEGAGATYVPSTSGQFGDISPDGRTLVFPEFSALTTDVVSPTMFASDFEFVSRLAAVDIRTNQVRNLSGDRVVEDAAPVYSPDGQWIVFTRRFLDADGWTPGRQLWRMRPDGGGAERITPEGDLYHHTAVRWSPDGTRLVYMRALAENPAGLIEIWVSNADGSQARRLTAGFSPEWLP
jgi:Tol biopolymer transport system component